MNRYVKAAWVARLEDPDMQDRQARGALCTVGKDGGPDKMCCLGVLTEMAIEAGVDIKRGETTTVHVGDREDDERTEQMVFVYTSDHSYTRDFTTLPQEVKDWAGLNDRNPDVDLEQEEARTLGVPASPFAPPTSLVRTNLASLNDKGVPFKDIAAVIREHL